MKQALEYLIARFPYGWALCPPPGSEGVPMDALSQVTKLAGRNAVMHPGLATYVTRRLGVTATLVVGDPKTLKRWEAEVAADLAPLDPISRWWMGLDTGTSSEALLAALGGEHPCAVEARRASHGAAPKDADDLGRCLRLVHGIPGWDQRLPDVAAAYPETTWPALVAKWADLRASSPEQQTEIIRAILDQHSEKASARQSAEAELPLIT